MSRTGRDPVSVVLAPQAHSFDQAKMLPKGKQDLTEGELQAILDRISTAKAQKKQSQKAKDSAVITSSETGSVDSTTSSSQTNSGDSGIASTNSGSESELDLCKELKNLKVADGADTKEIDCNNSKHSTSSCCHKKHKHPAAKSQSVDTANPVQEKSTGSQSQGDNKWLSPQEFFQLSRLRSTALASQMAGNRCSVRCLDCSDIPNPLSKPVTDSDASVTNLIKDVKAISLKDDKEGEKKEASPESKEETPETKEGSDSAAEVEEGGLLGRGPIHGNVAGRSAYAPYLVEQGNRYTPQRYEGQPSMFDRRPIPDGGEFVNKAPMDYFAMQQQKNAHAPHVAPPSGGAYYPHQYSPPAYMQAAQADIQDAPDYHPPPQYYHEHYHMHEMNGSPYSMQLGEFNVGVRDHLAPQPSPPNHPEYYYQVSGFEVPQSPEDYNKYASPCMVQDDMQNVGYNGSCAGSPHNALSAHLSPASAYSGDADTASPFADEYISDEDIQSILNVSAELPDSLSDFILKYSRRYSTDTPHSEFSADTGGCPSNVDDLSSIGSLSAVQSPYSIGSCAESSPPTSGVPSPINKPKAASKKVDKVNNNNSSIVIANNQTMLGPVNNKPGGQRFKPIRPKQTVQRCSSAAKNKLRATLNEGEFETGWAWALRCRQAGPAALYYRDQDGDSLLHICVWHKDLGKVIGLVEMMLRDERPPYSQAFDLPNKMDETPMFLAVEKRLPEVVAYLLECGADPNRRSRNRDGDAAIHYAAARGMSEIVAALAASGATNVNIINGSGVTPLLCAVKNHGVMEEENQCLVNSKPTIRTLLKQGADAKIPEASNGKTVLHYAVERLDPDLVEIFRDNCTKEEMHQLVNTPSYNGDTPLHILGYLATQPGPKGLTRREGEEDLRRKMFLTLISCGADVTLANGQGQCPIQLYEY